MSLEFETLLRLCELRLSKTKLKQHPADETMVTIQQGSEEINSNGGISLIKKMFEGNEGFYHKALSNRTTSSFRFWIR